MTKYAMATARINTEQEYTLNSSTTILLLSCQQSDNNKFIVFASFSLMMASHIDHETIVHIRPILPVTGFETEQLVTCGT